MRTNPNSPDSDRDGMQDAREVLLGFDPLHPDTDNDGLLDSYEQGVPQYRFTNSTLQF